jgi:hypothetical protein
VATMVSASGARIRTLGGEQAPTSNCPINVAITEGGYRPAVVECYDRLESPVLPRVECLRGLVTIHMQVVNAARRVRLTLSSGQSVTSPVITVPPRLGGPAALYYQAVRGAYPRPAFISPLGSRGRVLNTVRVPPAVGCMQQRRRRLPGSGGVLASVTTPGGRVLAITAEETELLGHRSFGLAVVTKRSKKLVARFVALRLARPVAGARVASPAEEERIAPLEWAVVRVCEPTSVVLMLGALSSPSDAVMVHTERGRRVLRRAPIPAAQRPHSVLVYGAMTGTVKELLVRTSGGRTLIDEQIGAATAETRCVPVSEGSLSHKPVGG